MSEPISDLCQNPYQTYVRTHIRPLSEPISDLCQNPYQTSVRTLYL